MKNFTNIILRINLRRGVFGLEGNEAFIGEHLKKFEDIFKAV